jgi:GNAT superfamily N-acetyltransferase
MSAISVVPFHPKYAGDFRRLNLDWIERLFKVEAPDLKVLDNPGRAIVEPGGMIFFALEGDAVVGTVAMIRVTDDRYALAKMAVPPTHQNRGIGRLLGDACRDWVTQQRSIRTVFLETNSKLDNAIHLYGRLGFRHAPWPHPSDYARGDVYMELKIEPTEAR